MRITLRNRHRMIWMFFVFAIPMFLAYSMQLALLRGEADTPVSDSKDCQFTPLARAITDAAMYSLDNGDCSYAIHVELLSAIRRPELALIVSKNPIQLANLSGAGVKYFEGNKRIAIDLALPTAASYEVALADLLRNEIVDSAKLNVQ